MKTAWIIGAFLGIGLTAFLVRIKGIHLLAALVFAAGGLCAAFVAYLACYPILGETDYLFLPALGGFALWCVLIYRLVRDHRRDMRSIPDPNTESES